MTYFQCMHCLKILDMDNTRTVWTAFDESYYLCKNCFNDARDQENIEKIE